VFVDFAAIFDLILGNRVVAKAAIVCSYQCWSESVGWNRVATGLKTVLPSR
jgi:hypothetical protein